MQLYVNQNIKPNYVELGKQYNVDYRIVKSAYDLAQKQKKRREARQRK